MNFNDILRVGGQVLQNVNKEDLLDGLELVSNLHSTKEGNKILLTRELIETKFRRTNNISPTLLYIVGALCILFPFAVIGLTLAKGEFEPSVLFVLISVLVGIAAIYGGRSLKKSLTSIKNQTYTITEDIVDRKIERRHQDTSNNGDNSITTTERKYYIDLQNHRGEVPVSRSEYLSISEDDIVYVVESDNNQLLGVYPKRLYELATGLYSQNSFEGDSYSHREYTKNPIEKKKFKIENTFEK